MSQSHPTARGLIAAAVSISVTAGALLAAPAATAAPASLAQAFDSKNTSFVQRDGSRLTLDGQTFRASGTNIYWLGLDENVGGVDYPTFFRIKDALDTASRMGVNVVRSHMVTSTGQNDTNPLAIMPRLGEFNEEAFKTVDFAMAYAGSLGIRFILPLTDEWSYYHGGHRDFTTPLGLQSADFYTAPAAISEYQKYVDMILSHTNSLTGKKYVDDPTILAWELGNELEGMTPDWINQQVEFIAQRAPQQLIAAGRRFDIDPDTLTAPDLDIVDVHYYPPTVDKVAADSAAVAAAGKAYIAGEYASTAATGELLDAAAANPNVSGMFFWSLFGNNDRGGLVPHDDGFTLDYPGDTDRMRQSVTAIEDFGRDLGLSHTTGVKEAPLVVSIEQTNAINRIAWRGTAGAVDYTIQRRASGSEWVNVTAAPVGPSASPVTDLESPAGAEYRVIARAADNTTSSSDSVDATSGTVMVDPLSDWRLTSAHAGATLSVPGGARATSATATATWKVPGIARAAFRLSSMAGATVETSVDGNTWAAAATNSPSPSEVVATDLNAEYVRVSWASGTVLERATVSSSAPRVALFDPLDDFSLTHAHNGSLSFDTGNPALFSGDTSRVKRDASDGSESLTWTYDNISGADLIAYYWPDQPVIPLTISGSSDGQQWRALTPAIDGGDGNWKRYTYRLRDLQNLDYIRVSWEGEAGQVWTPQISQISIYSPNAPQLGAPGDVSLQTPVNGELDVRSAPTFTWLPVTDAAYYRFELSRDADMGTKVASETGLTGPSYRPAVDLEPGTTYYWHVVAVNGLGTATSPTWSFTTAPEPLANSVVDDFESYADDAALTSAYVRNTGGGAVTSTLATGTATPTQAGSFAYDLGAPGYAGVVRSLTGISWFGYTGLGLTLDAPVGSTVTVQFVASGGYWETRLPVTQAGPQPVTVDFSAFAPPAWAGESRLDLSTVTAVAFYFSGPAQGTVTIDDVVALAPVNEPAPGPEPTPGDSGVPTPGDTPSSSAPTPAPSAPDASGPLATTGTSAPLGFAALGALLVIAGIGGAWIRRSRTRS